MYAVEKMREASRYLGWPLAAALPMRIYRLYNEEGLSIRAKLPRRKRAWRYRAGRPQIISPNEIGRAHV